MNKFIIAINLSFLGVSFNIASDTILNHGALERLFTTAKQRIIIDNLKTMENLPDKDKGVSSDPSSIVKTQEQGNRIQVHGLVKKNNGLTLTWIKQNGQLKHTTSHSDTVTSYIKGDPIVNIIINGKTQHIEVKPGQTYFRNNHKVYDDWQLTSLKAAENTTPKKHPDKTGK